MKKTSGILLAFIFACTVQVHANGEYTIEDNRLDFKYKQLGADYVESYKLSSIVFTRKYQFENDIKYSIFMDTGSQRLSERKVDKDLYNKILDYMEDNK